MAVLGRVIDGKDEYIIRVKIDTPGTGTYTKALPFTVSKIIATNMEAIAYSTGFNWFPIPMGSYNNNLTTYAIRIDLDNSNNTVKVVAENGNFQTVYINICYINR